MPGELDCAKMIPASISDGLPRIVEFGIAAAALIVFSPIMAAAALAIVISSRGGAYFRQERVGKNGRTFILYKLRTMRAAAGGPELTAAGDPRVTAVGRLLRRTKLDEIPQLWNVLRGDMSLVGPRPEVARYVDPGADSWRFVLQAKPGIVDPITLRLRNEEGLLSQLNGNREGLYLNVLQPFKLRGYEEYLRSRSALADAKILVETAIAVLFPARYPPPSLDEIVEDSKVIGECPR